MYKYYECVSGRSQAATKYPRTVIFSQNIEQSFLEYYFGIIEVLCYSVMIAIAELPGVRAMIE